MTIEDICNAQSEQINQQDELDVTVNVVAYKNPDRRPYKAFLRAMEASEKFKALAPNADINFQLVSLLDKGAAPKNIGLRFVGTNVETPIFLTENALFRLDKNFEKETDNAELIVSAKAGSTKFKTSVRTPALPENERRLGDLRLECEMEWAMNKEDLPFIMKAAFTLGGGLCHSSKIAVAFSEVRKIKVIWLIDSGRMLKISSGKNGKSYVPPLYDESWGNETKLVFEYDDEAVTPD